MSCIFVKGIRNREEKERAARMITSSEVDQILTLVPRDDKNTESHREFMNRWLHDHVTNIFLELVDDHVGPVYWS